MEKCAVFYQQAPPPIRAGSKKPMKPGGYRDSGADMAVALNALSLKVLTPHDNPQIEHDADWVFPDTLEGFQMAFDRGARIFWLNTVLHDQHPILQFPHAVRLVGQDPRQGVRLLHSPPELEQECASWRSHQFYGSGFLLEEWLPGCEITVSVLPPGSYQIAGKNVNKTHHWALPAVERFDQVKGVMPYNGDVPVIKNSRLVTVSHPQFVQMQTVLRACEQALELIGAKGISRVDCRQDASGTFKIFDLNMKPNLTGAGRPGREDQDSLSTIAAQGVGWSYAQFLSQLLNQAWTL